MHHQVQEVLVSSNKSQLEINTSSTFKQKKNSNQIKTHELPRQTKIVTLYPQNYKGQTFPLLFKESLTSQVLLQQQANHTYKVGDSKQKVMKARMMQRLS